MASETFMSTYRHRSWPFSILRFAHRFITAADRAAERVVNEDYATFHYEGRNSTRLEEFKAWREGFVEGWRTAPGDGPVHVGGLFDIAKDESTPEAVRSDR